MKRILFPTKADHAPIPPYHPPGIRPSTSPPTQPPTHLDVVTQVACLVLGILIAILRGGKGMAAGRGEWPLGVAVLNGGSLVVCM
jgi:hypothetical protein